MADQLDQVADAEARMGEKRPDLSSTRDYVYVIKIGGKWKTGRKTGTTTQCNDHIARVHKVDLGESKWARGCIEPNGSMLIHPQNDRDAVTEVRRLLSLAKRR